MAQEQSNQVLPRDSGPSPALTDQKQVEDIRLSEEVVAFPAGLLPLSLAQKFKILRSIFVIQQPH